MTPRDFFDRADALPFASVDELLGPGGLVVVAPHPDDESLGCGGLLALSKGAGRRVTVVIVSDGAGSHPNSRRYPADRLRDLREAEAREAIRVLGLSKDEVLFLSSPDGAVPVAGAAAHELSMQIAETVRRTEAGTIAVTWRHDPHCDHQSCFALAEKAAAETGARVIEYPVWGHTLDAGSFAAPIGVRVDVSKVLEQKRAAIAAHRSQTMGLIDDPAGFVLSPDMISRFTRPFEIYIGAA